MNKTPNAEHEVSAGGSGPQAILYQADGSHCTVASADLAVPDDDGDLLWIDVASDSEGMEALKQAGSRLHFPSQVLKHVASRGDSEPLLRRYGDFILVQAVVLANPEGLQYDETLLTIAAGHNMVITAHDEPIAFIEAIRKREHGDNRVGLLGARSFVAALLHWQLDTYHDALASFECAVESLEEAVLDGRQQDATRELVAMRRAASKLRRVLAPHRVIFSSLSRPDFQPEGAPELVEQFHRLEEHFTRAMEAVEHARELVIGSFGVFSNQVALRTNDSMRLLTFATVVIGIQAVIAGMLGMNFKAGFFTDPWGFWIAIGAMVLVAALAIWWGRRKDWI